ncbi:MAG: hypothetical protein LUD51_03565 [Clostridia bacterium]|nr:hypothetical protein [Clostridia bacterium]
MNSGACKLTSGLEGLQLSINQIQTINQIYDNEIALADKISAEEKRDFYMNKLAKSCPLSIPSDAEIEYQTKNGYMQVAYTFSDDNAKYTCRWHTRNLNAMNKTKKACYWVIEKHVMGKGYGKDYHPAGWYVLTGISNNGEPIWTTEVEWRKARNANYNNHATEGQKELLESGHWEYK